ncbi:uncharacterized protein EV420DRAFT_1642724 [Desarmillaria tabescens]|uniref:Uncharacterized protein n=1 Tax=Armillaria tabescens TaxID=1929756 RepID=A0AA39KDB3_ARMTA|nr:uncharacterized protein EV420DRAFT_1642724 [Desarmillaria tabescens]KAK0459025.1 hypothetical protein EV420DRAFT_1642724 [Desarmillaria tabescens]
MTGNVFQEAATYKPFLPSRFLSLDLTEDEAAFCKAETGIQDDVELKSHILAIPEEAFTSGLEMMFEKRSSMEFWDLGRKLFKSTPESFSARFIPADVFELKGLVKQPIASNPSSPRSNP